MRRIFLILSSIAVCVALSYGQWEKRSVLPHSAYTLVNTPHGLLASTYYSLYRSMDSAQTWDSLVTFPGPTELLQVGDVSLSVARLYEHRFDMSPLPSIFRSEGAGQTWESVLASVYGVRSITLCGSTLYANPDGWLFSSSDTGRTWIQADTTGILPKPPVGGSPGEIGHVFSDGITLYVLSLSGDLYRSTDQGLSWDSLRTDIPLGPSVLARDGALYVGAYNVGFFVSSDRGETWTTMNAGFPDSSWRFGPVFQFQNYILTCTRKDSVARVYRLRLGDTTWEEFGSGLTLGPHQYVLHFANDADHIFLAAIGGTIWWRPIGDLVAEVKEPSLSVPAAFMLGQNYPNPFNPATTIRYALPHRTHVALAVFNTLGQQVATLVHGEREAGQHEIQFDANNLASGVYFYRMQAGSFVETRKLLLVR
jgi:hypothetical protein